MTIIARLRSFLLALLQSRQVESEMEREWRFHIDTHVDALVSSGMSRVEAERQARIEFGDPGRWKEASREVRGLRWIQDMRGDVRYALRQMRRAPAFTVVVIATFALGIGANTAMFGLVNALLLRALPVTEPNRLLGVAAGPYEYWSHSAWQAIQAGSEKFGGTLAYSSMQRLDLDERSENQRAETIFVSGDFFTTLGVQATLGRIFTRRDDLRGGGREGPVAVISYGFWQRRFGGAPTAIGAPIVLDRIPFTVIGVTPRGFFGVEVGRSFDVALPIHAEPLIRGTSSGLDSKLAVWLRVMVRLKPDQSRDAATAVLRSMQPRIRESGMPELPALQREFLKDPLTLLPAHAGTSTVRQQYGQPLVIVFALVTLLLLIAGANISNLVMARATARRKEMSVRLALGASRSRVARQLLAESLLLAAMGASVGLSVASLIGRPLVALLSTPAAPAFLDLSLDWRVTVFAIVMTIVTTVILGSAATFGATRSAPIEALTAGWRRSHEAVRRGLAARGARSLIVSQTAISLVLLLAAGLFVRTLERLANVPVGIETDRLLIVRLGASRRPVNSADLLRSYDRLVRALSTLPGVAGAAGSVATPLTGSIDEMLIEVSGAAPLLGRDRTSWVNFVTPGWFAAHGVPTRAGREIDDRDTKNALSVIVVNDAFVRRFLPARNPIGATVRITAGPNGEIPVGSKTIIGVAGDVVYRSLRDSVQPTVYIPLAQWDFPFPPWAYNVSIRSSGAPPASLAPTVAATLAAADADLPFTVMPLADQVNASIAPERLVAKLSGAFGALALLLVSLGLYGVASFHAARRRAEIGIRIALGAQPFRVVLLLVHESLVMTSVGIVVGLTAVYAVSRYIRGMLFGVNALEPSILVAGCATLLVVATVAAFVPTFRATRADPLTVLRCE